MANDFTCKSCGKKLAELEIKEGMVAIKCKCGLTNTIEIKYSEPLRRPVVMK